MKTGPAWYERHVEEMKQDRPKEFVARRVPPSTEEYVREWCERNGLKYAGPQSATQRRKTRQR